VFGTETREALIAFQKREGIEATGSIDTRTVGSLGLQDKIKAGGARGELGTGSSSGTGEGARNDGQNQANKSGEPGKAKEPNKGATANEPNKGTQKGATNADEPNRSTQKGANEPAGTKGSRGSENESPNAKKAQPGKGSLNASPSNSGRESEKQGPTNER